METNRSLMDQLDRLKMEQTSWDKKQETLQENLFNIQKNFTAERTQYQKEIAECQSKAVRLSSFFGICTKLPLPNSSLYSKTVNVHNRQRFTFYRSVKSPNRDSFKVNYFFPLENSGR